MRKYRYTRHLTGDNPSAGDRQLGVALVTALLVVSLASIAAVAMTSRQALDIRRTANLIDGDNAWLYATGAESWARVLLTRDREESDKDSLDELWASHEPQIEIPGGALSSKIEDMQGRFNINNLITQEGLVDPASAARFQRLLRQLELDPDLAQAVTDWIDKGIEAVPPSGAEDDYYLGLEIPYRTANRAMADVSELRLIKGFDQKTYNLLAPLLVALPSRTPINVNTAPAEIIESLSDKIDKSIAEEIVAKREEEPFEKLEDFTGYDRLRDAKLPEEDLQDLSVSSDYFLVSAQTVFGQGRARTQSLVARDADGKTRVLIRSLNP